MDTKYQLLPIINASFSEERSAFSEYYFYGVCNREKALPDFVQKKLDENIALNPSGVLHLSVMFDCTDAGFARILTLLKSGVVDNRVLGLSEKPWFEYLSLSQMDDILQMLLKCETNDGYFFYFFIGLAWLRAVPGPALENILFEHTAHLPAMVFQQCPTQFVQMMELMPQQFVQDCILLVTRSIDYSGLPGHQTELFGYIQQHINGAYAKDVTFEICNHLEEQSYHILGHPFSSLICHLPVEAVLQWIGFDSNKRAKIIAYHLPAPSLSERAVPEITLAVLKQYGNDEAVFRRFFSGIHAFESYSFDNVEQNREKTLASLAMYDDYPLAVIRRWAEDEKNRIDAILEEKQKWDAVDSRLRDS